jgi:hypothetical protein
MHQNISYSKKTGHTLGVLIQFQSYSKNDENGGIGNNSKKYVTVPPQNDENGGGTVTFP